MDTLFSSITKYKNERFVPEGMYLVLAEPRLLKESVNVIADLVTEVTIKVDKDKIAIVAIDPSLVAMVDFKLLSSAFVEYQVAKPEELAINLDHLRQVLKRAKPIDTVTLSLDGERLQVLLKGEHTRAFTIPLITIEENEQMIPKLSFTTSVTLPSEKFDEVIEDMGVIAESLTFQRNALAFVVKSTANLKEAKVEIPLTADMGIAMDGEDHASKYSIEYLKKISKASKLADQVTLEFGTDYPLHVEYTLLDKLRLSFILAPRVSTD